MQAEDVGVYHLSQNGGFGKALAHETALSAELELAAATLAPINVQALPCTDSQEVAPASGSGPPAGRRGAGA